MVDSSSGYLSKDFQLITFSTVSAEEEEEEEKHWHHCKPSSCNHHMVQNGDWS